MIDATIAHLIRLFFVMSYIDVNISQQGIWKILDLGKPSF